MLDMTWLASEAQKLHGIFQGAFFSLVTVLLLLAIVLDYFRIPLGGAPGFSTLVARCLIATMLLIAMPEIMNAVANITDAIAHEVGNLNNFKLVLSRMGDKLKTLSWSWTSIKDMVTLMISFLSFFILYITVYFADAAFLYSWTLIYVFSPIILALFVLPVTSGATSAMFRSMIEVSLWKIVWASMAALLWSTALSDINKPEYHIDFLTAIVVNLMLALSVLLTPLLVRSLFGAGVSGAASAIQGMAMAGAALTPMGVVKKARAVVELPISSIRSRTQQGRDPKFADGKSKKPLRKSDPPPRPKK
jgi:hypothetical protein